uniref:Uncharacterized protein n=1 Tax=Setaria italica TaxID=4555 RepID=K3YKC5_SETIT
MKTEDRTIYQTDVLFCCTRGGWLLLAFWLATYHLHDEAKANLVQSSLSNLQDGTSSLLLFALQCTKAILRRLLLSYSSLQHGLSSETLSRIFSRTPWTEWMVAIICCKARLG